MFKSFLVACLFMVTCSVASADPYCPPGRGYCGPRPYYGHRYYRPYRRYDRPYYDRYDRPREYHHYYHRPEPRRGWYFGYGDDNYNFGFGRQR